MHHLKTIKEHLEKALEKVSLVEDGKDKYDILTDFVKMKLSHLSRNISSRTRYVDDNMEALELIGRPGVKEASGILAIEVDFLKGVMVTNLTINGTLVAGPTSPSRASGEAVTIIPLNKSVMEGICKLSRLRVDQLMELSGSFSAGKRSGGPMPRGYSWAKEYLNRSRTYPFDTQGFLAVLVASMLKNEQ